jgi:hypothetical protein
VLADFIAAFRHPVVLTGSLAVAFGNVPMITWVALSPVILIEHGGMSPAAYAWTQVPVFSGLIIASAIVANVVKDPTSPRFIWRTVPIQLTGLLILLVGNLLWPHVWFWSVLGTSIYALGIGLLYPVLFRFTLFSHHLPKGTVSATLNILALSAFAASIEATRWIYFHAGGRIAFHCAALMAGIAVVILVSRLLNCVSGIRRHQQIIVTSTAMFIKNEIAPDFLFQPFTRVIHHFLAIFLSESSLLSIGKNFQNNFRRTAQTRSQRCHHNRAVNQDRMLQHKVD